jgi:hypothetical protein
MRKCPECKFSKPDDEFPERGENCRQCRREQASLTRRFTREAVLRKLGGQCVCCGEREYVFLDLDHVNNDGSKDRKKATWRLALREPHRFQILCRNCNWGKYRGGCPHQAYQPKHGKVEE